jgi:hypothetical protein
MTPAAQRIAIAEAHDFEKHRVDKGIGQLWKRISQRDSATSNTYSFNTLPDYLASYDAIFAAIKTLPKDLNLKFASSLAGVMKCGWYQSNKLLFATPPQLCEAFLKTIDLWVKEEKN